MPAPTLTIHQSELGPAFHEGSTERGIPTPQPRSPLSGIPRRAIWYGSRGPQHLFRDGTTVGTQSVARFISARIEHPSRGMEARQGSSSQDSPPAFQPASGGRWLFIQAAE